MADVLVVFGSKSDSDVYEKVVNNLKDYELKICSAHKSPNFLDKVLQTDFKVVIAGAGLAAHLPGVIASKTIKPVIGVPCSNNFKGLDAFLSIVQMPPGIPVMSVGVDKGESAANYANLMLKPYDEINIIGLKEDNLVLKCIEILKRYRINFGFSQKAEKDKININFTNIVKNGLVVNVPVFGTTTEKTALRLLKMSEQGLWVGAKRAENAAFAAMEIMDLNKKYTGFLKAYREKMEKKIIDANKFY